MRLLDGSDDRWGLWLAGREDRSADRDAAPVLDPYRGEAVARVEQADARDVARAVRVAAQAQQAHGGRPGHERAGWLHAAAQAIEDAVPELVDTVVRTLGKPRRAAQAEARRGPALLRMCAEEIARLGGETIPLDAVPGGEGRWSLTWREPYGVAGVVTPFNAPVNLLLQKVAPALAVGNAVVAKPAPEAAVVTNQIAELMAPCLPEGLFNVVHGGPPVVLDLVGDPGVSVVSLTGGTAAGQAVLGAAGIKPVLLELGSNSPNIVLADADLDDAARRIAAAAFEASGQQCISAQRILVHAEAFDAFVERVVGAAKGLVVGDPDEPSTQVGPVVHDRAADRLAALVADAEGRGATVLLDGRAPGRMLGPTLLADVPAGAMLLSEEAFGPVAVLVRVADLDEAIAVANDVPGMLQASCFTADLAAAMHAAASLRAGSVWINEATRFRLDVYPFGGYGQSGIGREGVRSAMEALSQVKHVGVRPPARP